MSKTKAMNSKAAGRIQSATAAKTGGQAAKGSFCRTFWARQLTDRR
ncbi:hypothetical protein [Sulfitobacter sp.]